MEFHRVDDLPGVAEPREQVLDIGPCEAGLLGRQTPDGWQGRVVRPVLDEDEVWQPPEGSGSTNQHVPHGWASASLSGG